jgi:hypothetical protein
MSFKISIKDKGGTKLLSFPTGRKPIFVELNKYGIKDLVTVMLADSQCRGVIFDLIVEERFTPPLRDAMIRRLCGNEADQERLLGELVKVGFRPVTIREEMVEG